MKQILSVFLMMFFIICFPISSFADSVIRYELKEADLSLEIPADLITFTRDVKSDDPNLYYYGFDKESLKSIMESKNIYLNAWDEDINFEIAVKMEENAIVTDFNMLSDNVISAFSSLISNQYEQEGATILKTEIYQHKQAKFIKFNLSQPSFDDAVYALQYLTEYNGQTINIIMYSYSGKIDTSKEKLLEKIVDSILFGTDPVFLDSENESPSFEFVDSENGLVFTVPDNWIKADLSKERETIRAKFTSTREGGLSILYGFADIWDQIPANEKIIHNRNEINESFFSVNEVADWLGYEESDISIVKINGKKYYKVITETVFEEYDLPISFTMTSLFHIENGYMYSFQFGGTDSSPYYNDFEILVSSVKYPTVENEITSKEDVYESNKLISDEKTEIPTKDNISSNTQNTKREINLYFLLPLILVILGSCLFVIYKIGKDKKNN